MFSRTTSSKTGLTYAKIKSSFTIVSFSISSLNDRVSVKHLIGLSCDEFVNFTIGGDVASIKPSNIFTNSLSSYCICKDGSYKHEGPIRFNIYDRIGGGDAFDSGVIHGLIKDFKNPTYALKFGLATSILKHTLYGDVSTLSKEEIEEFIETNGNAAVQR